MSSNFWSKYWELNRVFVIASVLVVPFVLLPILIVEEIFFKRPNLYECKINSDTHDKRIVALSSELLVPQLNGYLNDETYFERNDSELLNQFQSDTIHIPVGTIVTITRISPDSSFAEIYFRYQWRRPSEVEAVVLIRNLRDCHPLVSP